MVHLDFKNQTDTDLRAFADLNPVAEWPLGYVREIHRRDYRPIADRQDLIEICENDLRQTLERVALRFSELSAELWETTPAVTFPSLLLTSGAEMLAIDELAELDDLAIASPQLEDALLSRELGALVKKYLESSMVIGRWSKAGVIAAFVAAGGTLAGLVLQWFLFTV